jgi:phosphoribosyl 1,2-cyclic phosphate phosphodiesterase
MRSCTLLNDKVLIDISPDIYAQKLRFHLNLAKVKCLVVTHTHEDHFDAFSVCIRGKESCSKILTGPEDENRLEIYGTGAVSDALERMFASQPNMKRKYYSFHLAEPFQPFKAAGFTFTPFLANHKKDELCLLYAIDDGEKTILYANDTDAPPDVNYEKMAGMHFDLVSMDCARGQYPGDGHMGIHENLAMRRRLEEIGCADGNTKYLLNHISHMCDMTHDELQKYVAPYGFQVTYDGLTLNI